MKVVSQSSVNAKLQSICSLTVTFKFSYYVSKYFTYINGLEKLLKTSRDKLSAVLTLKCISVEVGDGSLQDGSVKGLD